MPTESDRGLPGRAPARYLLHHKTDKQSQAKAKKEPAQQLRPLLFRLHEKLPFEVRELVYSYLLGDHAPRVVPVSEEFGAGLRREWEILPRQYTDLNPFRGNYLFKSAIVGDEISAETREYFARTTPLYFRGSRDLKVLGTLLDVRVAPHRALRDVLRHLRIYVRCEGLRRQFRSSIASSMIGISEKSTWPENDELKRSCERQVYDSHSACLSSLRTLPLALHSIRLEICVFHDLHDYLEDWIDEVTQEKKRLQHNLKEGMKPVRFHAKKAGATIAVRYEGFHDGDEIDMTWSFERDALKWQQHPEPQYILFGQDGEHCSQARSNENEISFDRSGEARDISWKHYLFSGWHNGCTCAECRADREYHSFYYCHPRTMDPSYHRNYCPGDDTRKHSPGDYDGNENTHDDETGAHFRALEKSHVVRERKRRRNALRAREKRR